jgi:hypothetical protein
MNEDYSAYEQIEEFLKGNLKGNNLTEFQQKMESDKEFSETVRAQKVVNEMVMIKHLADLKGKMQQDLKGKNFNFTKKWKFGAFLGLLLVASVTVWTLSDKYEPTEALRENKEIVKTEQVIEPILKDSEKAQIQEVKSELSKASNVVKEIPKPLISIPEVKKEVARVPVLVEKQTEAKMIDQPENPPKFDCSIKQWKISVETSPTCSGKKEGSILIFDREKHEYSIDEGQHFATKKEFNALAQGTYHLIAKDADGCEYKSTAEVKSKKCKTLEEFVFNPSLGNWIVPSKDNSDVEVTIVDKSGQLVWKKSFSSQQPEWDGKNNQGQLVEIGLYSFRFQYSDGDSKEGYISVMY